MQTTEWKRHWKVIAATTAVSALGLGGAALADSRDDSTAPAPITLTESANVRSFGDRNLPLVGRTGFDVGDDLDSPFDDQADDRGGNDSPDDTNVGNGGGTDSPDDVGTTTDSPDDTGVANAVGNGGGTDSPDQGADSPDDDGNQGADSPESASADS